MQVVLWLSGLFVLTAGAATGDLDEFGPEIVNDAPVVPLVRVLATPNIFDGKAIEVRGVVHLRGTDCAVYLSKEAAEQGVHEHGLWLELAPEHARTHASEYRKLDGAFVRVVGFFSATMSGPRGGYSGGLAAAAVSPMPAPMQKGK